MKQQPQNQSTSKQLIIDAHKSAFFIEPITSLSQNISTQDRGGFMFTNANGDENNTFITGVRQGAMNLSSDLNNGKILLYEIIGLFLGAKEDDYKKIHSDLNGMIGTLDEKIDSMITKHEKDFMAAYRGHMLKIQKEMEYLKRKVTEQEFMLRRDEKISSLEKQLEWFRSEALALSKTSNKFKTESELYKQRCENLEEEKGFLQIQVTKCKRQTKLLKMALGKTQENCTQLIQYTKDYKIYGESQTPTISIRKDGVVTEQSEIPSPNPLKNLAFKEYNDTFQSFDIVKQFLTNKGIQNIEKLSLDISQAFDTKLLYMKEKIDKLKDKNETLERELKRFKTWQYDHTQNQSLMQKIFIECIETVKKDIEKRRNIQQSSIPFQQKDKTINKAINMNQYFEYFQQQDKMKVIELLVQNDSTLKAIYNSIFGKRPMSSSENKRYNASTLNANFVDTQILMGLETERTSNNAGGESKLSSHILALPSPMKVPQSNDKINNQINPNYDNLIRSKIRPQFERISGSKYSISKYPMTAKSGAQINHPFNQTASIGSGTHTRSNTGRVIVPQRRPQSSGQVGNRKRLKSGMNHTTGVNGGLQVASEIFNHQ